LLGYTEVGIRTAFRLGLVMAALLLVVSAASVLFRQPQHEDGARKALIYDPLYETQTAVDFTDTLEEMLTGRGFNVEAYRCEEATIERLKKLSEDYSLMVFRVHSGVFEDEVWLFTGEEFDASKHVGMQLVNEVHVARSPNDPRMFFAVGPRFVGSRMGGVSSGLVVLMGCDGLGDEELAVAFVEAGADAVVGWVRAIRLSCSDETVLALIRGMLNGESLGEAVSSCSQVQGVSLLFYPEGSRGFSLG
jgi:hypothetical protein